MAAPRYITHNGITLTIGGWARKLGMSQSCLSGRLIAGKSLDEALVPEKQRHFERSHPVLRPELMAMQGRLSAEEYMALADMVGEPREVFE